MKVILLENLRKIGSIGDIIDVKRGFARNFLISSKKALYASKENIKEVEKIKSDLAKKDNDKKAEAQKIFEQINNKKYLVKKLSTETGAGEFFAPARKLFKKFGFQKCEPFAHYKEDQNSCYYNLNI